MAHFGVGASRGNNQTALDDQRVYHEDRCVSCLIHVPRRKDCELTCLGSKACLVSYVCETESVR